MKYCGKVLYNIKEHVKSHFLYENAGLFYNLLSGKTSSLLTVIALHIVCSVMSALLLSNDFFSSGPKFALLPQFRLSIFSC